jgi:hypothetical protein
MDVVEGTRANVRSPVGFIDITEGSLHRERKRERKRKEGKKRERASERAREREIEKELDRAKGARCRTIDS